MYSGNLRDQQRRKRFLLIISSIIMIVSCVTSFLQADQEVTKSRVERSIVKQLRYLDANKAKEYLLDLGIGRDINKLGSMNALIITTDSDADRVKASSLMALIDSKTEFELIRLKVDLVPEAINDTASVEAMIEGLAIGTLSDPPESTDMARAIIDVQGSELIAMVPKGYALPIVAVLEDMYRSKADAVKSAEVVEDVQGTSDIGGEMAEKDVKDTLVITTLADDVADTNTEFEATVTELSNINPAGAVNDEIVEDDAAGGTDFINEELWEALATVEQETEGITVTEKTVSMVETEPAMIAEQVVVTETAETPKTDEAEPVAVAETAAAPETEETPKTDEEAEPVAVAETAAAPETTETPKTEEAEEPKTAADMKAAKNKLKPKEPSMADLLAKIGEMTSSTSGAKPNPANKPSEPAAPKPVSPKPVVPSEPVKPSEPANKVSTKKAGGSGIYSDMSESELETTISLPTKVLVIDLLKMVGEQLDLNYMYDPKEITGEVTLFINDGKIKVGQLYGLLEDVLQFKNFAMTRRGKFVTIVPKGRVSDIQPKIVTPGEDIEAGHVVVIQRFELENIDTKTAMTMLDSMKLGITVRDIPQMGSLIITGYASHMDRIDEVLKMIDKPGKDRIFQFRYLKYTMAPDLVSQIQQLTKELGTVSITVGSETTASTSSGSTSRASTASARVAAARAAAAARATGTSSSASGKRTIGGEAGKGGVYLDIDDRTNRILMIGLSEEIDVVSSLIDSLDIPQSGLKELRQYNIVHVEASYIIDILGEIGATAPSARPATPRPATTSHPAGSVPSRATPTTRGSSSSAGTQISLLEGSNSLLINASPEEHDRITAIIKYVDMPKQDSRNIVEYEIENVDAAEIINTMAELGIISSGASSSSSSRRSSSTSRRTSTTAPASATSSGQEASSSDLILGEPMIAILEATNSLLINATDEQHAQIAVIIAHVDRDPEDNALPYVIYALTSQTALELKPILDEVINAQKATNPTTKSSTTKTPGVAATSKVMSTQSSGGSAINDKERIEIVADENTNSLIVYASKNNQTWIGKLIDELDEYRPQVLLDVTLVEITKDDEFNFDLDLVSKAGGFVPGEGMESSIGALLAPFPDGGIFESRSTSGAGNAFYADRHVQALFEIMDKKGYGRVLARPSLLVKDNEPGQIKTTMTRYVAQEKSQTTYSGTTATPNVSSDVTFQAYPSGITLDITPHISSEKLLQLEILLDRKDFILDGESEITIGTGVNQRTVPKPYDETSSTVSTWAILPDGATIILGGIETVSQNKSVTKVPILGDIPLLGALFRGIDESDRQTKLYVFVKAHIINPGDELTGNSDIEKISLKKRNIFEEDEKRFQGLQAVPGIKPKPMKPERILEDDEYLQEIRAGQQVGGNVISIPVVTPAGSEEDVLSYEEYLRKIRQERSEGKAEKSKVGEIPYSSEAEDVLEEYGSAEETKPKQLMKSRTTVEIVLPE